MNEPVWSGQSRDSSPAARGATGRPESANLADILERILDKGIVIAGDIRIDLLDIELLTIKIRLIVASVDRAKEMGIDWWEHDPALTSGARDVLAENEELRRRLDALEAPRDKAAVGSGEDAGQPAEVETADERDEREAAGSEAAEPPERRSRSGRKGERHS